MRKSADKIAKLMADLGNVNRLLILCALAEGPLTVNEIALQINDISGPALSQHLNKLREDNLIQSEKEGHFIRYSIRDARLYPLMEFLKKEYCEKE